MKAKREMTSTTYRVLNLLRTYPKSRLQLAHEARVSDRRLRDEIRTLRENGYMVCSNSQSGGYWLGTDRDIERTSKELMARGVALIRQARLLMPVGDDGDQMEIGGI